MSHDDVRYLDAVYYDAVLDEYAHQMSFDAVNLTSRFVICRCVALSGDENIRGLWIFAGVVCKVKTTNLSPICYSRIVYRESVWPDRDELWTYV